MTCINEANVKWLYNVIKITLKINIFKVSCLSILLNGSESRIITHKTILTVFPPNVIESCKTSNGKKRYQMKLFTKTLNKNLQRRQLRFIGHCIRRDKEEFSYQ